MSTENRSDRVLLALLAFGVMAGGSFMFVKVLVAELTPLQVVAGRTSAAALSLGIVLLLTRTGVPLSRRYLANATVLALLDGVLPYLLIAWAQLSISSATAAILVSTMPLFTTLFAFVTGENQSPSSFAAVGLVTGFMGAAVLVGPAGIQLSGAGLGGTGAVILAAACYALAAVFAKRLLRSFLTEKIWGDAAHDPSRMGCAPTKPAGPDLK